MSPQLHGRLPRAVLLLLFLGACGDSCSCSEDPIAQLVAFDGTVTRDRSGSEQQWVAASDGEQFSWGDGVRTAGSSTASLSLRGGGGIQLVENTVVRFLEASDGGAGRVGIEMGEASLTAGEDELSVVGEFGEARLEAGGQLTVTDDGSLIVTVGRAQIETADGTIELAEGQEWNVEMGAVQVEVVDAGVADAAVDAPIDAPIDAGPAPSINVAIRGRVEVQDEEGSWTRAPRDLSMLVPGSRVRISRSGRMTVSRGADTLTLIGTGETTVGSGAAMATIGSGRANASASEGDVVIGVPGGAVIVHAAGNSRADTTIRGGSAVVNATRGTTQLRGTADDHTLRAPDNGTLRADGNIESQNRAPGRAHIAINAGSSVLLHDPAAPVAVRVRFGSACPGEGVVELSRGRSFGRASMRSFGTGSANITAQPGSNRYRVRCVVDGTPAAPVAEGSISVDRNSGRGQLPRRPSRNVVDTDGRRYTLLYQNLLPIVMVRWPDAPAAGPFTLHLQAGGGATRTFSSNSASHTLRSGEVPEGNHQIWFQAGSTRSPTTTIRVSYDNAASAVFLREPAPRPISGGTVRVSGIALEGWTIAVGGTELPLDAQYRFSGSVAVPSDVDALAIRTSHARHGVHYYLRRIAR